MSQIETIMLAIAIVCFIIYRQFKARKVKPQTLIVFPVILLFFGIIGLLKISMNLETGIFILASAIFSIFTGVWRASTVTIWQHKDGTHMYKGTKYTFAIWAITFLGRIGLEVTGNIIHNLSAVSASEIPLFLGLTIGAQNLVIGFKTIYRR